LLIREQGKRDRYGQHVLLAQETLQARKSTVRKIKIKCPTCGKRLSGATSEMIEDIGVCPSCGTEFEIQAP